MAEETNQALESFETELPDSLFGEDEDYEPTEETVKEEEVESADDQADEAAENHGGDGKTDGGTLRVKYNGEEKDISLDEARTLAQKGMNYDHVVSERDRNRSAFDFLSSRAKAEGKTVEQFIEDERKKAENQRFEKVRAEIRENDDDASDETVDNLARNIIENQDARSEREAAEKKAAEEEEKRNSQIEAWKRLFAEHPELIGDDGNTKVSQGVLELVQKGHSPTEAYYIERARELEEQNKILTSEANAKKKSVGSLSAGAKSKDEDDFLAGFNEV